MTVAVSSVTSVSSSEARTVTVWGVLQVDWVKVSDVVSRVTSGLPVVVRATVTVAAPGSVSRRTV